MYYAREKKKKKKKKILRENSLEVDDFELCGWKVQPLMALSS